MTKSKKPKVANSKQPVPALRSIVPVPTTSHKKRDPRFDTSSGFLNEDLFKKSYPWLDEMHMQEKTYIKKQIETSKSPEVKDVLKKQLTSLESRDQYIKRKEEEKMLFRRIRKEEKELIVQGKRPFYLKKSEKQKLLMVNKYKKAVADGANIQDILERRRRHTASQQHKKLPRRKEAPSSQMESNSH